MRPGGRADTRGAEDSGMFIMTVVLRVLLVPLLLIAWSASGTEALPVQDKPAHSNEVLSKEQDLLVKILSELAELNMTAKDLGALDLEQLLSGKLGERSPPVREKSPCKHFFWKTFSSC